MLHNHFTNTQNCGYALDILTLPYLNLDEDETTGMKTPVILVRFVRYYL